jgi:hypothetical protein
VLIAISRHPDTAETAAQALIDFGRGGAAILESLRNEEDEEIVGLLLRSLNAIGGTRPSPASCPSSITRIR